MSALLLKDEGGDWEALYVDGRLAAEGHSLDARQVLEALGVEWTGHSVDMQSDDWPGCPAELNPGRLPDEPPV